MYFIYFYMFFFFSVLDMTLNCTLSCILQGIFPFCIFPFSYLSISFISLSPFLLYCLLPLCLFRPLSVGIFSSSSSSFHVSFFLTTCIIHYFRIFQYFSLSTLSSLFSCICDFRYSCKGWWEPLTLPVMLFYLN